MTDCIQIREYLPVWRGVEHTTSGREMVVTVNYELGAMAALERLAQQRREARETAA